MLRDTQRSGRPVMQMSNPSTPPSPEREVGSPVRTPHTPIRPPSTRRAQPIEVPERNRPSAA